MRFLILLITHIIAIILGMYIYKNQVEHENNTAKTLLDDLADKAKRNTEESIAYIKDALLLHKK